jgi:hypothetical protein
MLFKKKTITIQLCMIFFLLLGEGLSIAQQDDLNDESGFDLRDYEPRTYSGGTSRYNRFGYSPKFMDGVITPAGIYLRESPSFVDFLNKNTENKEDRNSIK